MTSYNLLDSSTLDKYRSAIYSSHTPLYNKNEHAVNSAFHCQQSIDFLLHGCYTATWHLETQEYSLYLKDYDLNAHTGHLLWWAGLYRKPSFVFKMSSGAPDLKTEWQSNLIQFRKSRPRPRSGCASRQEAEYGADRLGQERGWRERQNGRI